MMDASLQTTAGRSDRIRLIFCGMSLIKAILMIGLCHAIGVTIDAGGRRDSLELAHALIALVAIAVAMTVCAIIANRIQVTSGDAILATHESAAEPSRRALAARQSMAMASGFTPGFFGLFGIVFTLAYASVTHPAYGITMTALAFAALSPILSTILWNGDDRIRPGHDDLLMPMGMAGISAIGGLLLAAGATSAGAFITIIILTGAMLRDIAFLRPMRRYLMALPAPAVQTPTASASDIPEDESDKAPSDASEMGPSAVMPADAAPQLAPDASASLASTDPMERLRAIARPKPSDTLERISQINDPRGTSSTPEAPRA